MDGEKGGGGAAGKGDVTCAEAKNRKGLDRQACVAVPLVPLIPASFLDHVPAPPLGDLAQLPKLIFDSLLVGRYPNVDCGSFLHFSFRYAQGSYDAH